MIRSPQAFFISLLFHGLLFLTVIYTFVPKPVSVSASEAVYCTISLAQVVPALSKPVVVPESKPPQEVKPKKVTPPKPVERVKPPEPVPTPKPLPERVVEVSKPEPVPAAEPETEAVAEEESVEEAVEPQPEASAVAAEGSVPMQTAVPAAQSRQDYLDAHLARIAALLQKHLYYPRMARKRHIEGEVMVSFTLECDGSVRNLMLKKRARPILDRAALKTVESVSGKFPHPKNALTLEIPIRFVLR